MLPESMVSSTAQDSELDYFCKVWIVDSHVSEDHYKVASLSGLPDYQTAKVRGNFQGHTYFSIF